MILLQINIGSDAQKVWFTWRKENFRQIPTIGYRRNTPCFVPTWAHGQCPFELLVSFTSLQRCKICQSPNLSHYYYLIPLLCIQAECITEKDQKHGDWDFSWLSSSRLMFTGQLAFFKQNLIAENSYCGELLLCFVLDFQSCPLLSNPFQPDSQKNWRLLGMSVLNTHRTFLPSRCLVLLHIGSETGDHTFSFIQGVRLVFISHWTMNRALSRVKDE